MPPNNTDDDVNTGQPIPGFALNETWCAGNARADVNTTNIENGYLFPYNRNPVIYRCPADHSPVEPLGGLLTPDAPEAPLAGLIYRQWVRNVPTTIAAGTLEVQKNIIARRGLGLPRAT